MYSVLEKFIKSKVEIDAESLDKICSCFKLLKTKRNQILLDYSQVCNFYYFINKGSIRLFTISKDGNESSRFFAFQGSFATALPSFIDQLPAEEYLQTIEKSELFAYQELTFIA
jgi:CRP-like cAMP-binding protein